MKGVIDRLKPPGGQPPSKVPPRPQAPGRATPYDAIVFSSGGSRGIGHLGALAELEKRYDLSQTRFYVGTSVGAIAACIACLGLRARDVFDACVIPFKYEKNLQIHLLTSQFGLDRGASLDRFIASIVPPHLTFGDVFRETNHVLSILGTNLTTSSMAVFDPIRTPEMTIRDALRISCSIPFMFTAVERDGHLFVDGALTSAFPVNVAIDVYGCRRVLGLNFEEYSAILGDRPMTFEDFLSTVVDTVVYANSKHAYTARGATVDVCTIEMSPDVNGLALDLTEREKRDMYDAGQLSMRFFIKKKS
jgi:predicted acylesterase/phospholipase RssA